MIISQANFPTGALPKLNNILSFRWQIISLCHANNLVTLILSSKHHKLIKIFAILSPLSSAVLGFPWLKMHNPHIDRSKASMTNRSALCHSHCLHSAIPAIVTQLPATPEPVDLSLVPSQYHNLSEVCSKDCARLSLPPHRPIGCAIDLLPGAPLKNIK